MKRILKTGLLLAFLLLCGVGAAQPPVLIHSHNDYTRTVPFYQAYAQRVSSIEADVFLRDGVLVVGHDVEDLVPEMTFEKLYVEPLVTLFARNGGRAWKDSDQRLQLMVELKSETEPTLRAVVALLQRWPAVFDPAVNSEAVRVTVTGRVPEPADFDRYPAFVRFDGAWDADYTPAQLERIALVSANFRDFSQWNGKGSIIPAELARVKQVIDRAHAWEKPVRFWGAPEGTTVYYTFYDLGIDYINTDRPETCAAFFDDFANKNFCIGEHQNHARLRRLPQRQAPALARDRHLHADLPQRRRRRGDPQRDLPDRRRHGPSADHGWRLCQPGADDASDEAHRPAAQQCARRLHDRLGGGRQRPGHGRAPQQPPHRHERRRRALSVAFGLLPRRAVRRGRADARQRRGCHADGLLRPLGRA